MSNLKPAALEPFTRMTANDRDHVLMELGKRLQYMSIVSLAVRDSHWRKIKRLAETIERDHETLSTDTEKSAMVVYQALDLLTKMDSGMTATRH